MIEGFFSLFGWLARAFTDYKVLFERTLAFSDDAVHVFIGVLIQLVAAVALRTSIAQLRPLLAVLVLEVVNEMMDITHEIWPSPSMQLGESLKDVVLTLALPCLLFFISRRAPWIFFSSPGGAASSTDRGSEKERN